MYCKNNKIFIYFIVVRGWLARNRIKKMQQQQQPEANKFLMQVSNISNSILAKLVYQKNFLFLSNQSKKEKLNW